MAEKPTPFGKYFLLERINVGGMAEVFKAKTVGVEGFEKVVAIKRILPSIAEDEEFIRMFIDEAKITSQLTHANLAQTFDLGRIGDAYFIAMEFVAGRDLRAAMERLRRKGQRFPRALAAAVMARVCEGLDYAHRKRDPNGRELDIVHRDVSPQNIILSFEGEVKLIDFGIAQAASKLGKTQAGFLKGKFGYMSPEQVRGDKLDKRSDIFSAGVVLYELCTGERLFGGGSDQSVLQKVQEAEIVPPSVHAPDLPKELEAIAMKALAREPAQRYQEAAELAADLHRFAQKEGGASGAEALAELLRRLFPDEARSEEEMSQEPTRAKVRASRGESDLSATPPEPLRPQPAAAPSEPSGPGAGSTDPQIHLAPTPPGGHAAAASPPPPPPEAQAATEGAAASVASRPLRSAAALALQRELQSLRSGGGAAPAAGEEPTRPISMEELAAAEKQFASAAPPPKSHLTPEQQALLAPTATFSSDELQARASRPAEAEKSPSGPPRFPLPAAAPLAASSPPPPPRSSAPPPPSSARAELPFEPSPPEPPRSTQAARSAPPAPFVPQRSAPPRPSAPPFRGGPQPGDEPTLALSADEHQRALSRLERRRFLADLPHRRGVQVGVVVALGAVLLAWIVSRHRKSAEPALPDTVSAIQLLPDPPDAELWIDGKPVRVGDEGPWSSAPLSTGAHTLEVRRPGFAPQTLSLDLTPGERRSLEVHLSALPVDLWVRSEPSRADVFLDGERAGTTPLHLTGLTAAQAHAISVELPCYRAWQLSLPPNAGSRQLAASLSRVPGCKRDAGTPLSYDLAPPTEVGLLSVESRPAGLLQIDGVDLGLATPLSRFPLHPGPHTVSVWSGSRRRDLHVEVRGGQDQTARVDLRER